MHKSMIFGRGQSLLERKNNSKHDVRDRESPGTLSMATGFGGIIVHVVSSTDYSENAAGDIGL